MNKENVHCKQPFICSEKKTTLVNLGSVVSSSLRPHGQCSLPGSSAHGIFQAKILGRVAISYSRWSSQPRDQTHVSWISYIGRRRPYKSGLCKNGPHRIMKNNQPIFVSGFEYNICMSWYNKKNHLYCLLKKGDIENTSFE